MELDVDSVLRRHAGISAASFFSSSDEDTDDQSFPRRTVDDILNDSDSSSSSPSPSSPAASSSPTPSLSRNLGDAPPSILAIKDEAFRSNCIREDDEVLVRTAASETKSLVVGAARTPNLREDSAKSDGRLGVPRYNPVQRFNSDDLSVFTSKRPSSTSSLSSRPLGSLFGGVRSSAKPGAALAAAAAASRSVLTPHAAAIKSRRAMSVSLERKLSEGDGLFGSGISFSGSIERASTDSSALGEAKLELEDDQMGEFHSASLEEKINLDADIESDENTVEMRGNDVSDSCEGDIKNQKGYSADDETGKENEEAVLPILNADTQKNSTLNWEIDLTLDDNEAGPGLDSSNSELIASTSYGDWDVLDHEDSKHENVHHISSDSDGILSVSEDVKRMEGDSNLKAAEPLDSEKDGSQSNIEESGSINEDVTKLVEDRLAQLESERSSKKADDKSRPPKKPLELAEEFENKQASTGLHLEEGAAAQPMRLEGVRRGSTVLGYFDIDADNMVTQNLSSQEFRLVQGSAQVLAVHHNYIAVGMSKGVVVVVPSKYSVYHPDNMGAKMLILGHQADRPQAPVTSICFNLQGDMLLAGYGDGLVVFWDVPKASAVKVISGEHKAPVVHAFFLGQDPQVSRAFKAITGDGKGLVLLHTISVMPFIGRFTVETQCCLDGQKTGTVLCAVPLLADGFGGTSPASSQGNVSTSSANTGGKVGGVVGGYSAWKLFTEVPSLSEEGVVIFVTHKNALVVRLSPSLEVYAQLSRPEGVREGSMPYAAWKCTTQSCGSSTENSPVEASEKISLLAIAWDRKVQVAKLVKSDLKFFGKWTLDSAAIGLTWLNDQMLVVFTVTGQLCLFGRDGTLIHQTSYTTDRFGGEELIAYHTYFSNIFGNPEKSYHNSLAARGASVYILGPMHLVVSRLLPWKERIQVLRKAGDWMGALNMVISLYDGQSHGVIDLPRSMHAVQEVIMPYLVELLFSYVDEVFSYISVACTSQIGKREDIDGSQSMNSSIQSEIKEQFTRVGGVAVEFCVHIKRTDILFEEVFSKFVAINHRDTFLELLEPYILKDMLGSLPPEIMQALVEHYNHKGWLQRVEQCVLHMDISSLDFNQVVRLCQEHGLYGALIYLFNKGLDDFRTPLEELLTVLRTSERDNVTALGYRMLVYLKYCFMGLAFPPGHGTLDPSRVPSLRVELLQFLLQKSAVPKSRPVASLIPARSYINLYYLLELDTEAALEVLRCAFLEDEFAHSIESHNDSPDTLLKTAHSNLPILENQYSLLQSIIDALVDVLLIDISEGARSSGSDETGYRVWPSRHDIGLVIEFIAAYVACRRAVVLKSVLSQIFEYLTSQNNGPSDDSRLKNESVKRKEKQVLSLLNVVPETDWNASYVLHLCEKAEFFQICGYIHCMRHQYLAALDSYMKDVDEPVHAFSFINATLLHPQDIDPGTFRSAVISRIPKLTSLSRECTLLLVIDHLRDEGGQIFSKLRPHPRSLFLYLKTLIEAHLSGTLNFSFLRDAYTVDEQDAKQSDTQQFKLGAYLERVSEFPKLLRNYPVEITDDIIEIYVELLCQFEPDSVLKFLESFESYRVENCLRLCQKYGIIDGAAFLLERVGDVGTALQLTLSGINEKFMMLDAALENIVSEAAGNKVAKIDEVKIMSELEEIRDINKVLRACVGLCQRNTPRLDPEESEILWFQLLDSFCKPLVLFDEQNKDVGNSSPGYKDEDAIGIHITWKIAKTQRSASILKRLFAQFLKEIVEGMIRYVRLPSIMEKLLADNASQEFGDFKLTILGMLGTYGFERRILDTAKSLIEDDTFYTMSMLRKGASHGYAPRSLLCCVCNCPFNKTSSVRVFQCGHATHSQCQHQEDEISSQSSSSGCPICMPKKKTQPRSKVGELGLLNGSNSRPVNAQGTSSSSSIQHAHEIDALENSRLNHQFSRFDILANLRKNPRMIQIESLPQLRLAPPALYHEKVKKGSFITAGSSSSSNRLLADGQKPSRSKSKQLGEIKTSGSSLRFPLKSRIFGKEKSRVG